MIVATASCRERNPAYARLSGVLDAASALDDAGARDATVMTEPGPSLDGRWPLDASAATEGGPGGDGPMPQLDVPAETDPDARATGGVDGVAASNGLHAQYFSSASMAGRSVVRVDAQIHFDWGDGEAHPEIPDEDFSVRWTGRVLPLFSETYSFVTRSDDGARVWVDGRMLIDYWVAGRGLTEQRGAIALEAGRWYDLRVEYFDDSNVARMSLLWTSPSQPLEVIPSTQLMPP